MRINCSCNCLPFSFMEASERLFAFEMKRLIEIANIVKKRKFPPRKVRVRQHLYLERKRMKERLEQEQIDHVLARSMSDAPIIQSGGAIYKSRRPPPIEVPIKKLPYRPYPDIMNLIVQHSIRSSDRYIHDSLGRDRLASSDVDEGFYDEEEDSSIVD